MNQKYMYGVNQMPETRRKWDEREKERDIDREM